MNRHKIESVVKFIFLILGLVTIACVLLITVYLVIAGIPAIREIGIIDFLFGTKWASTAAEPQFGILPFILTSIYGTAGAIVIGVPIGFMTAVFTGLVPGRYTFMTSLQVKENGATTIYSGSISNTNILTDTELTMTIGVTKSSSLVMKELYYNASKTSAGRPYLKEQFYEGLPDLGRIVYRPVIEHVVGEERYPHGISYLFRQGEVEEKRRDGFFRPFAVFRDDRIEQIVEFLVIGHGRNYIYHHGDWQYRRAVLSHRRRIRKNLE